jgi:hypothetical protein
MWFAHHHKANLPPAHVIHKRLEEADKEQEKAKEELSLAKKIAREMSDMREENHFVRDWRTAMGIRDEH